MKFAKKLYIMTGQSESKGAVTVERNAFGTFADVSTYNLRRTEFRRYFAFISDSTLVFPMGGKNRFDLGGVSLSPAHVCVVCATDAGLLIELYGTDGAKRMWQGNLCDKIRGKINVLETAAAMEEGDAQGAREKAGEEKLLSLFPSSAKDFTYDDNAIAKVNYYSNIYSSRKKTPSEIAFEQARLAQLGEHLIRASLNVDEVCPPKAEEGGDSLLKAERGAISDAVQHAEPNETGTTASGQNDAHASGQFNAAPPRNSELSEKPCAEQQPAFKEREFPPCPSEQSQPLDSYEDKSVGASKKGKADGGKEQTDGGKEQTDGEKARRPEGKAEGENAAPQDGYKCDYARFLYSYRDELLSGGGHGFAQGCRQGADGEKSKMKKEEIKGAVRPNVSAAIQSESGKAVKTHGAAEQDEEAVRAERESAAAVYFAEEPVTPSPLYASADGAYSQDRALPYDKPYYGKTPPAKPRGKNIQPQSGWADAADGLNENTAADKTALFGKSADNDGAGETSEKPSNIGGKEDGKRKTLREADDDAIEAPKADLVKSEQALQKAKPEKLNFYERVKNQIDRLFEANPREPALEKLLPESRFVRVAVENSDKYYCVGLLGKPDYICYAVPAVYTPQPPEELDGYCQWLPADAVRPEGNGFWLIYQDAVTGDSLTELR